MFTLSLKSLGQYDFFFKEINAFIKQGHIKLHQSESKERH